MLDSRTRFLRFPIGALFGLWGHMALVVVFICWSIGTACAAGPSSCITGEHTVTVVDMAGRTVNLPKNPQRIATVGSVPVINSYLFALGVGDRIINGLPRRFTRTNKWNMQAKVAPGLAVQPVIQGQLGADVNIESLIRLEPDLVVTMDRQRLGVMEATRIPILFIEWDDFVSIQDNITLLGCVLGRSDQAKQYLEYFNTVMLQVHSTLEAAPGLHRPAVVYLNVPSMSIPLDIANWWINQAGGLSVTRDLQQGASGRITHEQLLAWDPDVIIVGASDQVDIIKQDLRFARMSAVVNRRVFAIPMGMHLWGQRTIEQPLTILWAVRKFHPELFQHVDMVEEVRQFYRVFMGHDLSIEKAKLILGDSV